MLCINIIYVKRRSKHHPIRNYFSKINSITLFFNTLNILNNGGLESFLLFIHQLWKYTKNGYIKEI